MYELRVDLVLDSPAADVEALLGSGGELLLERESLRRRWRGLIRRVEDKGTQGGRRVVCAYVVPALWQLSQRVDSRIFQEKTVPEIAVEVLEEVLTPLRRKVRLALQREYPQREYCVQQEETDLDFLQRLLAEEGIAFYFEQEGEAEELVLVDDNAAYRACETMDSGPVWVSNSAGELASVETVRDMAWCQEVRPTGVVLKDHDWTRPRLDLTKQRRDEEAGGREQYLYPGGLTLSGYDEENRRYTQEDGSARVRVLREAQQMGERQGEGRSNVTGFSPGRTFLLHGHLRGDLEQEYLLTEVEHWSEEPGAYRNQFKCIPRKVPFRPGPPPRVARVWGTQIATVVGPPGQEIYTDAHGRVKVCFVWDRAGRREKSSCWVRVAQGWAGPGFGTFFLPRVGMEVLVSFIDGDPNRPLVTGCVYNGANPVPLALPEQRTRSVLRTQSSPGGEGYNEWGFEDASGQEQIFLRAQRDLSELVKHDHRTRVENDQSNTVQANQAESIGGNQSLTVAGDRTQVVKRDERLTVEQNRTREVKGNETLSIHGQRTTVVKGAESHEVEGTRSRRVQGKETVVLEAGRETRVTGQELLHASEERRVTAERRYQLTQGGTTLTFEGGQVELLAEGQVRVVHGSGEVRITQGGKVSLSSGTEIELNCGGCLVTLKEGQIELSAPKGMRLVGGTGVAELNAAGAELSGPRVATTASAVNEVSGPQVNVNN